MVNRRSRRLGEGRSPGDPGEAGPERLSGVAESVGGTGETFRAGSPAAVPRWRARRLDFIVVLGAAGYAAYLSGTLPFTLQADIAVALPLALVVAGTIAVWPSWQGVEVDPMTVSAWAPWAVLLVSTVVWEVVNYLMAPRSEHPTLSSVSDHAMSSRGGKAVFVFVWLIAGWALLAGWRRWRR